MKKLISVILIVFIIMALAGCNYRGNVGNSPDVSPYDYGYTSSPVTSYNGTNNYNNAITKGRTNIRNATNGTTYGTAGNGSGYGNAGTGGTGMNAR